MHKALAIAAVALAAAPPAGAEIGSAADCTAAIAADPARARADAALWHRLGGGTEARLCEAAALEAMGATETAAHLLTRLAENPNRAMPRRLRATIFEDAARLWLDAGRPGLAEAALASAERSDRDRPPDRLILLARARAADADWPGARAALDEALAIAPGHATALALRAAAHRRAGDPQAALADAEAARSADPDLPEARFETAAALAELDRPDEAVAHWLALIEAHPDHPLAGPARRNVQSFAGLD